LQRKQAFLSFENLMSLAIVLTVSLRLASIFTNSSIFFKTASLPSFVYT
jgi:hypothetical protein